MSTAGPRKSGGPAPSASERGRHHGGRRCRFARLPGSRYQAPNRRGDYVLDVRSGALHGSRAFVVIPIIDREAPVIAPAPPVRVEQLNADGTRVRLDAPAVRDNRDPAPRVTSDAPETFPLGRTVVTWRAEDFSGNVALGTQEVTVVDTQPPTLRVVESIELQAESSAGTNVDFGDIQGEDLCDAHVEVTRDGPRRFPLGETTVTWTARDDSGNTAQAQTLVRVFDTRAPAITFANDEIVLEQTHLDGARSVNLPDPAVVDNADPHPVVEHNAPGTLGLGRTPVTFFARDASGNESTARINVHVVDTRAPTVSAAGAPTGWVRRAQFVVTATDVCDLEPDVILNPAPDSATREDEELTVAYTSEGIYDVALVATDDSGNRGQRVLRSFGIDQTEPRIRLTTRLTPPDDPEDQGTWPAIFDRERVQFAIDAADPDAAGASGIARVRLVLDPGAAGSTVLVDHQPARVGVALPAGPRSVRAVTCDNADVCTGDGSLLISLIPNGAHVLEVTVTDVAGNSASERRYFQTFNLREALLEARRQTLAAADGEGIADEAVAALEEAAERLMEGADLATDQPAGIDADIDLTGGVLRTCQRVSPPLARAGRYGVETDRIERLFGEALYWAVVDFGQVELDPDIQIQADYDAATDVYLPDARQELDADRVEPALASLVDAYFLFGNALVPLRATRLGEARASVAHVRDEIAAYIEVADRPGVEVLTEAMDSLDTVVRHLDDYLLVAGDSADEQEQLLGLAQVNALQFLGTLLELRVGAWQLQAANQEDVWTRNWGWGLIQTVNYLARLGRLRSLSVQPPGGGADAALLDEAEALSIEAQDLIDGRRVDRFLQLYLMPRTECVLIEVYNRAFDPDFPLPAGCE